MFDVFDFLLMGSIISSCYLGKIAADYVARVLIG
jgi:hypothetical protein